MTRSKLFLATLLMSISALASATVKIVPEPLEIKELSRKVSLPSEITVSALENDNMVDTYIELSSGILKNNGITLKKGGRNSFVRLSVSDKVNDKGAYMHNVGKRHIDITAADKDALWCGLQTLTQILMQKVDSQMIINDAPRFGYRGAMLDCGRHFFPVEDVKAFIDMIAVHKLNRFHWHLTEVAWSAPASLSGYQDFLSRLTGAMIPLYTSAGWPFAKYYEEDLK